MIQKTARPKSGGRSDRQILDTEIHAEDRRVLGGFGIVHLRLCAEVEVKRAVAVVKRCAIDRILVGFNVFVERCAVRLGWQDVLRFDSTVRGCKRRPVVVKRRTAVVVVGKIAGERGQGRFIAILPAFDNSFQGVSRPRAGGLDEVRVQVVCSFSHFVIGAFVKA